MKFELKSVKFYESMSEETNAFTADLFIDSKKVAYVKNDGRGGCTDCHAYSKELNEQLRLAEEHFKSLPKVYDEKYDFEFQPSLEYKIDELFEEWLGKKEDKKFEANMKKGILIGENKNHYSMLTWKGITLEAILNTKNPTYFAVVRKTILEQKAKGKNILNTNIPEELLS